jgi:hypothetical protein
VQKNQNQELSKGFLVVASNTRKFYSLGLNLIETIRDYYPEAKVCFVTEKHFCDGRETIADIVMHCGSWDREKLWAIANTPFDITMYIDADTEVQHEDIKTAFDHIKDHDIVFTALTKEREYCFAIREWKGGEFTLCGAVVLYNNTNPLVKDFMNDWYTLHKKQGEGEWWPLDENGEFDYENHPSHLRKWDQFTLWWLVNHEPKYKDLNIGIFDDDARWNYFSSYKERKQHVKKPPIIFHWSAGVNKNGFNYD